MSWSSTYSHTVLIAVDQFAAAVVFNRPDLTVSSMCWMVMTGNDSTLKLNKPQHWALAKLGSVLNRIQAGHCEQAAAGDTDRARSTLVSLTKLHA